MSDTTDLISSAYTSGNVTFTGLGSGTDFDTLIQGLVEAESYHLNQLETWKATWEEKMTAFQELNTPMLSLKTALEGMDTMSEFLTKTVASTDTSLLTATADSTAETGTHKVLVNQLAQNKIMVNNTGYASSTTVVNSSGADRVLQYVYKGTTYNITVPNGTTLEGLVNLINNQPANPGVKAMVLSDGTQSYLQFRGLDLGDDATLTIGAGTTLTGYDAAGWTTSQANQNSQIRVDGWPAASWISNSSNTITGAITGLTLNLKDADAGTTVTLTTDVDKEAVLENVRTFVEQMNTVRTKIQELTQYDETNQTGSILTGNYGVSMISQNLKDIVASKGVGFISYNTMGLTEDAYNSLAQLGITSATINGRPALISGAWEITGTGGTAEAGLAIRLDTHTAGSTFQGVVTLKLGKTGELANELKDLTNSSDGPLAILEDNYKDITESIDDKIAYEETRLARLESNLKDKFSRLDTLLGYYEQIATQLTSSIEKLSSSSS